MKIKPKEITLDLKALMAKNVDASLNGYEPFKFSCTTREDEKYKTDALKLHKVI